MKTKTPNNQTCLKHEKLKKVYVQLRQDENTKVIDRHPKKTQISGFDDLKTYSCCGSNLSSNFGLNLQNIANVLHYNQL